VSGATRIDYLDAAKTKVGVVFKLAGPVHFECEKTVTVVTVKGAAIGEITPINTKAKVFTVVLTEAGGVNAFTKLLNVTNTAFEEFTLKSETNGGAAAQAGQETTVTITMTKAVSISRSVCGTGITQ
jgi:hypothetical protein